MVSKIKFKNFKVFKEEQILDLRPITILIGKNNTGKSAVLKLPTLVEQALGDNDSLCIEYNNNGVVLGNDYKDLIYGKTFKVLDIEISQKNEHLDHLLLSIFIDNQANKPILERWRLSQTVNNETEALLDLVHKERGGKYTDERNDMVYSAGFEGWWLNNLFFVDRDGSETVPQQNFQLKTDFINGTRQMPKKGYYHNRNFGQLSGLEGEHLYDFLIHDYLTADQVFFRQVSDWVKDKFEGWELFINTDQEPYHIGLEKGQLKINLSETGTGIGQSLPLIIRAVRPCKEPTLIIIEEPENNLHPYAHAQIAQLFADSIEKDTNKSYLFETHSLNFILRMRRLVAKGKMKKEDLAIYYVDFDEEKNASSLKQIHVDDGGGVDYWPEGVFNETTIETRGIYNARQNNL
ncbi:MAG: DUF3696 domain-containing protein [Aureispira sp.]